MYNLNVIEESYKRYMKCLPHWIPEGIFSVDLALLMQFDLLHFHGPSSLESGLTRYFHVIESPEKITLINHEFVVWIIPERIDHTSLTYTLIALNQEDYPKLEVAFIASRVYNTSKLVLQVLEKFLIEIQENEKLLKQWQESA
jgi:hypothetical protein